MDNLGQWIENALRLYRSNQYARSILGGCVSLLALLAASIYFLFADQQF